MDAYNVHSVLTWRDLFVDYLKKKIPFVPTFLPCSQWLNCGGTREVRSDVSMLWRTLAAISVLVLITPRPPRPMTAQFR